MMVKKSFSADIVQTFVPLCFFQSPGPVTHDSTVYGKVGERQYP